VRAARPHTPGAQPAAGVNAGAKAVPFAPILLAGRALPADTARGNLARLTQSKAALNRLSLTAMTALDNARCGPAEHSK
jgi:hypothetical protein